MNQDLVDRIAHAVLYEGYLLYPYRPSVKNRHRWTFGGLYPEAYCQAQSDSDASSLQTECLIEGSPQAVIDVKVRFLHLQTRQTGDQQHQNWQEAVERTVNIEPCPFHDLTQAPCVQDFACPASRNVEPMAGPDGSATEMICREQQAVRGVMELAAEELAQGWFKMRVQVRNSTAWAGSPLDRDEALLHSLVSAHVVLSVRGGAFVSLLDPPEPCRDYVTSCCNVGVWPVLVGEEGTRDTMLASPIILYDYPQIAPESPGDLFDATEIDEILTLRILTLTDDEKRAMTAVDERAHALLQRTEALGREEMLGLHGTMRPVGGAEHA